MYRRFEFSIDNQRCDKTGKTVVVEVRRRRDGHSGRIFFDPRCPARARDRAIQSLIKAVMEHEEGQQ